MARSSRTGEVTNKMYTKITRRLFTGVVAGAALALTATLSPVAQAADFAGKQIRIIVPFSEGGGTDSLTRSLVPFMEKHLPGNPSILVINKPGAGGIVGGNYFDEHAKKDGTWVMAVSLSTVMNYMLGDERVKFDINAWEPIIIMPRGDMIYARSELGLKGLSPKETVEKLRSTPTEKLILGGKTPTSAGFNKRLALTLLGVEVKDVFGMKGAGPIAQAFERGEFTINFENALTYLNKRKGFRDSGIATEVYTHGAPDADGRWQDANGKYYRDPTWPDVPTYYELYEEGLGKQFEGPAAEATLALIRVGTLTNKSFNLPEGADEDAKQVWWDTLRKIMDDPEFKQLRSKILGDYTPTIGPAGKVALKEAMELSPDARNYIKSYAKERYNLELNL